MRECNPIVFWLRAVFAELQLEHQIFSLSEKRFFDHFRSHDLLFTNLTLSFIWLTILSRNVKKMYLFSFIASVPYFNRPPYFHIRFTNGISPPPFHADHNKLARFCERAQRIIAPFFAFNLTAILDVWNPPPHYFEHYKFEYRDGLARFSKRCECTSLFLSVLIYLTISFEFQPEDTHFQKVKMLVLCLLMLPFIRTQSETTVEIPKASGLLTTLR